MNVGDVEVGLSAEDCYLFREAIRRERARVRAFGGRRWLDRTNCVAAEIEAAAAAYESGASMSATAGHSRTQYSADPRSCGHLSGHRRAESLTAQEDLVAAGQVSAQAAAELLGVTARHVRRLAAAKQLQSARKVGRDWVVDVVEVAALTKEARHG